MEKLKEYYPALAVSEYRLKDYMMFIHREKTTAVNMNTVRPGIIVDSSVDTAKLAEYEEHKIAKFGYVYEAGCIVGIDSVNNRIYVRFVDTPDNCVVPFVVGIDATLFDSMYNRLVNEK